MIGPGKHIVHHKDEERAVQCWSNEKPGTTSSPCNRMNQHPTGLCPHHREVLREMSSTGGDTQDGNRH